MSADTTPKIKITQKDAGSIAIMLFKNLSSDEDQDYFCEGFSDDLISALSRFKKLLVMSSNASFSYASKDKTYSEIGEELGVRYLLEGKVRKLGNKMRISANLLSTEKGETGVDINSSAEILFQDGFKSKVHASFKDNLGTKSIIYGEKGAIFLNNSWLGGDIIVSLKDKPEQKLNFETHKSIYGYQIEEISKNLIQGSNKVNFPIMSLDETLLNMKIIDEWLNYG